VRQVQVSVALLPQNDTNVVAWQYKLFRYKKQ